MEAHEFASKVKDGRHPGCAVSQDAANIGIRGKGEREGRGDVGGGEGNQRAAGELTVTQDAIETISGSLYCV